MKSYATRLKAFKALSAFVAVFGLFASARPAQPSTYYQVFYSADPNDPATYCSGGCGTGSCCKVG
jgi:hypothetical protein